MEIIDLFIAATLVFGFYKGVKNGLFVELASLVAFFIGIFIALKFSSITAGYVAKTVSWSPKTIQVLSFIITLGVVILLVHVLAKLLSGLASFAFLGWANTLAGGLFGALKTMILLGIVLNLFQKINLDNLLVSKETQGKSILMIPCMTTSETLVPVLSDWFTQLKENAALWNQKDEQPKAAKDSLK